MKTLLPFLISSAIVLNACNNSTETTEAGLPKKDTVLNKTAAPVSVCYASKGRDTVYLQIAAQEKVVTGKLVYKLYEKDSNSGSITGEIKGDTLLAEYNFMSEGMQSARQVIFLLQDSIAVEGYADMEEKDGKMVFKKSSAISFGKGIRLQKTECNK